MNEIWREAEHALEGEAWADRKRRELIAKELRESLSEERSRERQHKLPKDLRCPRCKRHILETSRWTVRGNSAICRSCASIAILDVDPPVFMRRAASSRWTARSHRVCITLIKRAGLTSQRALGAKIHANDVKVSQVLSGKRALSLEEARVWSAAMRAELREVFEGNVEFELLGREMKLARKALGVSPAVIAELCGWTKARQQALEARPLRRITARAAVKLLQAFSSTCT